MAELCSQTVRRAKSSDHLIISHINDPQVTLLVHNHARWEGSHVS